ncbi:lysophospholipid acyltransferase family protein [Pseudonocardia sp. TRM90224]|uniref:lysophospholipid acyltransferase family protein n=1 Tax=Pseudonocardia sp. TRM90224 TaxID=2812678 RepID=UPI001E4F5EEF|nr:lysophospholipid acyltransferase family protein [Pseudonocardia sp. TRM90224]
MSAQELPPGAWPWLHDVARWLGTWIFFPFFRVRVHHADRLTSSGPVVLVANHSSYVDGPVLFGLFRRRMVFLVKHEMFTGPVGWGLVRIGQLGVKRGTPDRRPLMAAVGVLKAGGMIGVFPEGTRGAGDVEAAQHGAAWLARSAGATIVPVVCRGTRRPAGRGRRFRPPVDVLVGEPITISSGGGRAGLATATETIRAEMAGMVRELDEIRSTT